MQTERLVKYLNQLKIKTGLSYKAIGDMCNRPESTVKNLFHGKTDDPRIDTIAPIIYALGGSVDEMLNPNLEKDEIKETSIMALKESYEYQMSLLKSAYDEQVASVRQHYEQHLDELRDFYDRRIEDKEAIIKLYTKMINMQAEQYRLKISTRAKSLRSE